MFYNTENSVKLDRAWDCDSRRYALSFILCILATLEMRHTLDRSPCRDAQLHSKMKRANLALKMETKRMSPDW